MGTLISITGPTCAGKTTLQKQLAEKGKLNQIVNFTTRDMREGEVNGKDYYFISKEEVIKMQEKDEVAEYVEFGGNKYGIFGHELSQKTSGDQICTVVVEPQGARQLRTYCEEHGVDLFSVFITHHPIVLSARFLDRFSKDKLAKSIDYAKRVVSLFTEEQWWIHAANYDIIYNSFDSENEEMVVEEILLSVSGELENK